MGKQPLKNVSMLTLLILLFFNTGCTQSISPFAYDIQSCLTNGAYKILTGITPAECVCECLGRVGCKFLSYNRHMTTCFLHDSNIFEVLNIAYIAGCINMNVTSIPGHIQLFTPSCSERNCPPNMLQSDVYECAFNECSQPSDVVNAFVRSKLHSKVGQTTSYRCHEGYTMIGNPVIACTQNGSWTSPNFTCYPNCRPPTLSNAAFLVQSKPRLTVNTTVTFQCDAGYYNISPLIITCSAGGQWTNDAELSCLKYCSDPPIVAGAVLNSEAALYTIYSSVHYTCLNGYYLEDAAVVNCLDTGMWSTPTPKCNKYCSEPSVASADIIERPSEPYTIQSIAKFQCDWGTAYNHVHEGVGTIQCSDQGVWLPIVRCCVGNDAWWDTEKNKCCHSICVKYIGCVDSC